MGVGILISSYHCTWEFWYLLTIVHTQRLSEVPRGWDFLYLRTIVHTQGQFEVPRGWKFWYLLHSRSIWSSTGVEILISSYHCNTLKVNLKFHGGGNFDIFWTLHTLQGQLSSMGVHFFHIFFRPLYTLKGEFEVPWGWEFRRLLNYHCTRAKVNLKVHEGGNCGVFLPLYKLKVNLKLHGGGNFDIFLPLHTQRSSWSSMGVGNLISSYWCTHSMSIWSSMAVGILISSYHCTHSKVYLKFHGGGIFFTSSYHSTHSRSIWSSTGVEILISPYHCTHSRSIWSSWGFPRVGMRS